MPHFQFRSILGRGIRWMKPGRLTAGLFLIAAITCVAVQARGEEILLKNGQKIVGTIVGYEKDMFRVETEYGIALIRKDKVVSIQVNKPEDAKPSPDAPKHATTNTPGGKPASVAPSGSAPIAPPAAAPATAIRPSPGPNSDSPVAMTPPVPAPKPPPPPPAKPPTPPPPPVSHPLDVPMPVHLEEHVDGNTYISDTFQFSMFKPPDWKIYEGVPKETGSGIMAMGTEDEQTLLIVDRQMWSGLPKLTSDQVEAKLRRTYQEYRRLSEDAFQFDGQKATRQTFTGVLDGAEWHGVAVNVIHGNTVFGIIGLTSAETFQFQEAIFNKIIKTFHFLNPAAPGAESPTTNP
jgi:hypothetical protein